MKDTKTLALASGLAVLNAGIAEGNLLAFGRMDGSKALAVISTRNKAVTARMTSPTPSLNRLPPCDTARR